ncbi:MAG: GntR family transcriptional regulator [Acuticoccus sp.]
MSGTLAGRASEGMPDRRAQLAAILTERFLQEMTAEKATKRNALRLAFLWAIREHAILPGERLPSEAELTRILGLSLGTVQSALGQLQDLGLLIRRRGDGTRLASSEPLGPNVWHFRFRHLATARPMRILQLEVELMETTQDGPWSNFLGRGGAFTLIRRQILADENLRIGAEMYLKADKVPVSGLRAEELQATNIRVSLQKQFGLAFARPEHTAQVTTLSPRRAALFDLPAAGPVFEVGASVRTTDGEPFYYQLIYVPTDRVAIEF